MSHGWSENGENRVESVESVESYEWSRHGLRNVSLRQYRAQNVSQDPGPYLIFGDGTERKMDLRCERVVPQAMKVVAPPQGVLDGGIENFECYGS